MAYLVSPEKAAICKADDGVCLSEDNDLFVHSRISHLRKFILLRLIKSVIIRKNFLS